MTEMKQTAVISVGAKLPKENNQDTLMEVRGAKSHCRPKRGSRQQAWQMQGPCGRNEISTAKSLRRGHSVVAAE